MRTSSSAYTRYSLAALVPAVLAILALAGTSARAGELHRHVNNSVERFEKGDYDGAADALDQALIVDPDDPRVTFDRACVFAARGEYAEAIEAFRAAAETEDALLAAKCYYNLGCLNVDRAREAVGESPVETAPDARREATTQLENAIVHFREALVIDPNCEDARFNLEAVRLWLARMNEEWRIRDATAEREKLELLQQIQSLDGRQRKLRAECKKLAHERPSILRRQDIFRKQQQQSHLGEEIEPLKAKLAAAVQAPPAIAPGPGAPQPPAATSAAPAQPDFDPQQALNLLGGMADNAGESMTAAATALEQARVQDAVVTQTEVVSRLDKMYTGLAPYEELVSRAIDFEKRLVGLSEGMAPPKDKSDTLIVQQNQYPVTIKTNGEGVIDWEEAAGDQRFVSRYAMALVVKAQQRLQQLPPPAPAPPGTDDGASQIAPPAPVDPLADPNLMTDPYGLLSPDGQPGILGSMNPTGATAHNPMATTDPTTGPAAPPAPVDPAELERQRQEALRTALENAVKYGPQVAELSQDASELLKSENAKDALPKQQEALRLLELMVPKDPQQQQQDQQQNDSSCNEQCDNPGQSDQPQDNPDPNSSDSQNENGQQNNDDSQQDPSQNEDQGDPNSQDQQQPSDPQPQEGERQDSDTQNEPSPQDGDQQDQQEGQDDRPLGELPELADDEPRDLPAAREGEVNEADRRRIEALLLKAGQREKEAKEMEAIILQRLYRPEKVKRDW